VPRIKAGDLELASLLKCHTPVVVTGSQLVGDATERWTFEYLEHSMDDVDNFYVLCAPAESKGRFAYYDTKPDKNPCGHPVTKTNVRVEMRFREFRRKVEESRQLRSDGKKAMSYYLQSAVLHREEEDVGPPKPVGSFGVTCALHAASDIKKFRWDWLRDAMGGRHVLMCQLFCGQEGDFSPCHYDPQDNMFAQVRGFKRVLLFHPRHIRSLYPWPVHHPQDRQSRVDFDAPDLTNFPKFAELEGKGLETVVGPGDVLHIPPGWWHHIEMLPSPKGEIVSVSFWYPAPKWFYGDPRLGEASLRWDRPLFGVRRNMFQRCVEELSSQIAGPAEVQNIVRVAMGTREPFELQLAPVVCQAIANVRLFVHAVFPDEAERAAMLSEIVEGRFLGLFPPPATRRLPC